MGQVRLCWREGVTAGLLRFPVLKIPPSVTVLSCCLLIKMYPAPCAPPHCLVPHHDDRLNLGNYKRAPSIVSLFRVAMVMVSANNNRNPNLDSIH